MPSSCCAVGCHSIQHPGTNVKFYRIPRDPDRKRMWVAALNRKNWKPHETSRVCSLHFVSGVKSNNKTSPNYVPTVFAYKDVGGRSQSERALRRFNRRVKRSTESNSPNAIPSDDAIESFSPEPLPPDVITFSSVGIQTETVSNAFVEVGIQTEVTLKAMEPSKLEVECQALRSENHHLKEEVKQKSFSLEALKDNDQKVKKLTGISSFVVMMGIFNMVKDHIQSRSCIETFEQFLLTCMRMRFNLNTVFLAYLFGVSQSTVSRVFLNVVNVLDTRLVPMLLRWPDRMYISRTMPLCFKSVYPKCVSIVDCFEIFIERPCDLKAQAQTYSSYKSHTTVKYLISVTPQGVIGFLSKGWGGRTPDRYITEHCGYLDNLRPGDVVLADRGFDVEDLIALRKAVLHIPAFTKGLTQLNPIEVEQSREKSSLRIHVERVIGVVQQKYTILEGTIPLQLLRGSDESTTVDKIVRVCCCFVNACPSIIND